MKPPTTRIRPDATAVEPCSTVIARLDPAIQYAVPLQFHFDASDYWMPRLRGHDDDE
jgi:hypothetical protein